MIIKYLQKQCHKKGGKTKAVTKLQRTQKQREEWMGELKVLEETNKQINDILYNIE